MTSGRRLPLRRLTSIDISNAVHRSRLECRTPPKFPTNRPSTASDTGEPICVESGVVVRTCTWRCWPMLASAARKHGAMVPNSESPSSGQRPSDSPIARPLVQIVLAGRCPVRSAPGRGRLYAYRPGRFSGWAAGWCSWGLTGSKLSPSCQIPFTRSQSDNTAIFACHFLTRRLITSSQRLSLFSRDLDYAVWVTERIVCPSTKEFRSESRCYRRDWVHWSVHCSAPDRAGAQLPLRVPTE